MRLRKEEILRKREEIKSLFASPYRLSGQSVVIKYLRAEKRGVLFVASKRIKKATQRNLIKRRLKEIYRCNKNWFPSNYHFLLYATERALQRTFGELKLEIEGLTRSLRDG